MSLSDIYDIIFPDSRDFEPIEIACMEDWLEFEEF